MNLSPLRALRIYWHSVLSVPARILLLLQLVLLSIRLLISSQPLPGWFVESQSNSLSLPKAVVEALLLLLFQVQWCAWSEQLYSLRRTFQPSETLHRRPWRRFALHVYGGFVFLFVLSGLAAIQPLLGIGAMFLLFISAEAQDKRLADQSIVMALLQAMVRSYRLISYEPWRFLGNLVLPGIVLYGGGVLLVWMLQQSALLLPGVLKVTLIGLMLALWLIFFQWAQLRIGLRAEAELDVDVLMGIESDHLRKPVSPLLLTIKDCLHPFEWLCQGLALLFGLLCGGWLLLRLADSSLLSSHALVLAFSAMLSILSGTVSTFFTLLVKLGFVAIVSAALVVLVMLVIGVGRREPWKPVQALAGSLQRRLESLTQLFSQLNLAKGATLGLGTLLTVLGTVAVQTYDRVLRDQARQSVNRQNLQRQQILDSEQEKARIERNDLLVERIQRRVIEFTQRQTETARIQLLTELRDILPKLTTIDGMDDGERKGRVLRYLYEADLLSPPALRSKDKDGQSKDKDCLLRIDPGKRGRPAKDVAKELEGCTSSLFLHAMDFSGASLENAYLRDAFLPYLDLRYANLRNADLTNANLRSTNLENVDFTGANLTNTDLDSAILVGANLTNVYVADQNWPRLSGAEAFYASYSFPETVNATDPSRLVGVIQDMVTWDLVKADKPMDASLSWNDMKPFLWTFCPFDPVNNQRLRALNVLPSMSTNQSKSMAQRVAQAGSKCDNRRFGVGQKDDTLSFADRDWSGSSFKGSTMKGIALNRIRLDGADLSDVTFDDVTLTGVSFAGANLKGTVFRDSVLNDVDFSGAELQGMRFEGVQNLYNLRYRGGVVDFEKNSSFSLYRKNLIRSQVYQDKVFERLHSDEVAEFRRGLFLPLLVTPLVFRPQQLLYWMLAYPLPASLASDSFEQP